MLLTGNVGINIMFYYHIKVVFRDRKNMKIQYQIFNSFTFFLEILKFGFC